MIVCIEHVLLRCIYGMQNAFLKKVEVTLFRKMFGDIIFEILKKIDKESH